MADSKKMARTKVTPKCIRIRRWPPRQPSTRFKAVYKLPCFLNVRIRLKMLWGKKSNSYTFKELRDKKSVQGLSYTKKTEASGWKSCPHQPKQVYGTQQPKTGKLSRIL